jgi:hypothetical protein
MRPFYGGVGLGHCSACRAPGAFWYPYAPELRGWGNGGVWMCDSCVHPNIVWSRIDADIQRIRRTP